MSYALFFDQIFNFTMLFVSVFILLGGIILTFKTRFVQFRTIPEMFKLLFGNILKKKKQINKHETITARKALFTAMSTSIGLGNIAAPIIAIKLGGPGALLGFMLAAIFGSASTFTEVTFALKYRKKNPDGTISGGPMQYIKEALPAFFSSVYAYAGFIMLTAWSGFQTNQLADLLQLRGVPTYLTGIVLAIFISYVLTGGIKRIGNLSARIVPFMFLLYSTAALWIIISNIEKLPYVINLIFRSAFTTKAIAGAAVGYGLHQALRFGLARGFFANESGLGTATIPHSMSESQTPISQGILSMVSVYSNGILCLLTGLVVLLTGTWTSTEAGLGIGINIVAKSFAIYFSTIGIVVLTISALLFAFGTIVGNSYNGSQCFLYATKNRWLKYYHVLIALVIFIGAISNTKVLTYVMDLFYIPIAIPNIIGIIILAFKNKELLRFKSKKGQLNDQV